MLEEHEQRKARVTMPNAVRRVLTRHPFYRFVDYDDEVLDELEPISEDGPLERADARRFWEDVRDAQKADTPNTAAPAKLNTQRLVLIRMTISKIGRGLPQSSLPIHASRFCLIHQVGLLLDGTR